MYRTTILLLLALPGIQAQGQWRSQTSGTTASLRGVSAVSPKVVWTSGNNGTVLRTINGGQAWNAVGPPGTEMLDFRDVEALDANTAYVMSSGPGQLSRIYKTTDGGTHWVLQYTAQNEKEFLDGMAFWDREHGIALGDPVNGRFMLLRTDDGGNAWRELSEDSRPEARPGEAAFAASGTCIVTRGKNNVWFGTGGAAARVFRSLDRGRTWQSSNVPMAHGADSSGIFSLAFADEQYGVAVGGDYNKPNDTTDNTAVTTDGGRTWTVPAGARPHGYRSAVVCVRGGACYAVGTSGSDARFGAQWRSLDNGNYNAASFVDSTMGWAVGPNGRVAQYIAPAVEGRRMRK